MEERKGVIKVNAEFWRPEWAIKRLSHIMRKYVYPSGG
jgi:hypothetical protein